MNDLLNHLRPRTLVQMAAEIVFDHAENVGYDANYAFNFTTEAAKNAYSAIVAAGIANTGEAEFFTLLDEALAREWDYINDELFH